MLSIREIRDKTAVQRKHIKETMDGYGQYHPDFKTPDHTTSSLTDGLKPADAIAVRESMRHIPLSEFLAKSGTTGIGGAAYIVADKVHDDLIMYAQDADICGRIGKMVSGWEGGDLLIDIVSDESYVATEFSGGGQLSTGTVNAVQATIAPKSFGVAPRITTDLIDDAQW